MTQLEKHEKAIHILGLIKECERRIYSHETYESACKAGKYKIDYQLSAQTASANQEIEASVMVNSTSAANTTSHGEQMTANAPMSLSGTGILTLAVNDVVKFCVANHTATNNIVISHANMTLVRVE